MATSATWRGNDWKRELRTPEQKHIMELGYWVEGRAKQLCPVKFGVLMSSIHTIYNTAEVAAYVGTNKDVLADTFTKIRGSTTGTVTFYAPFVEFGTRKMKAQPFLRPALDELKVKLR